jgi:hypothetical protein
MSRGPNLYLGNTFFEKVRSSKNNSNTAVCARTADFKSSARDCSFPYEFSDNMSPGDVTMLA